MEIGHYLGFPILREFLTVLILVVSKDTSHNGNGRCQIVTFSPSLAAKVKACDLVFSIRHLLDFWLSPEDTSNSLSSLSLSLLTYWQETFLQSTVSNVEVAKGQTVWSSAWCPWRWLRWGVGGLGRERPSSHSLPSTYPVLSWKTLNLWKPFSPRKTRTVGYSSQLPHQISSVGGLFLLLSFKPSFSSPPSNSVSHPISFLKIMEI